MKKPLSVKGSPRLFNRLNSGLRRRLRPALAGLAALTAMTCAQAQVQTAGTLFINLDATTLAAGAVSDVTNSGSLGGEFEGLGIWVTNVAGTQALWLNGGSTNYLRLLNGVGGSLVPPPLGLVGTNATCSIEVWAFNPQVAGDEPMVAWGARSAGRNMAFEYGTGGSGGAQHNGTGYDIPWDVVGPSGSGGAPLNNHWHHLVYTYDGARQNLYSDGVLENSLPVSFATLTNAGIALGAQWTSDGTAIAASPAPATLAIARVRVHDGVLTPAQILSNYNAEKSAFVPAPVAPAFLSAGPVHRYSFNEPATNDASGLTIHDSVGSASGVIQASYSNNVPQLNGRRLVLPGGIQTTIPGYGGPYLDLPNGLVSANSTNNGGSGEVSIEVWYKNSGGLPFSWCRVFDIGSCGPAATQQGQEVVGTGGYPSGSGQLDYFLYAAQTGGSVNTRQLGWQNRDIYGYPNLTTSTNATSVTANVQLLDSFQTDRHLVVTWRESTGEIIAYENGRSVASISVSNAMSTLNDVNVWFGRSQSGSDSTLAGEYEEIRFYNYVLSTNQVAGDFQTGPNTINTAAQAASIAVQPQSQTVFQGWPANFYVVASGSPAVSYQWTRNGAAVPGATTDTYTLAAASLTNQGDSYSCVVSNFANSTANVVVSSAAVLTVTPNLAPAMAVLHQTKEPNPTAAIASQRDNYAGTVGGMFTVGAAGAVVTHLGMQDVYGPGDGGQVSGAGLQRDHLVSVYSGDGVSLLASVDVPAGTAGLLVNGFRYVALPTPLVLAPNTPYLLQAEVYNADGDMWADVYSIAQWDPYFVGTNGPTTRGARYGSTGSAVSGASTVNGMYGAPNLATLPEGAPVVTTPITNVSVYASQTVTLPTAINGQPPVTAQWYKDGSLLGGQTGASLNFPSVTVNDSATYYVIVSNALGTMQSSNMVLTVLADTPVAITQQPTNTSVPQGFPASFYITASGTPPIYYQWNRNGTPLAGATGSAYTLAAAAGTNNNDVYSCVVSNFANSSPHTLTSANATLTVQPNWAPVGEILYPISPGLRDSYSGSVGGVFEAGSSPAVVTHLGYACPNGFLNSPHNVALFTSDGSSLLAIVSVGAFDVLTNGYAWVALTNPVALLPNASYLIAADVFSGSGDPWPDVFSPPTWNPYFVGANGGSTREARYSGSGVYLPNPPLNPSAANSIYGAANLALLPVGPPVAILQQTNVTAYVGSNVTFTAFVNGAPSVTVQWYKAPSTLLAGQTSTSLNLQNLGLSDAGNYYLVANNSLGSAQSGNVSLTVLSTAPPAITQQPQPQTVYVHQTARFTVGAAVAPDTYQWYFNGSALAGATTSSLVVPAVTAASAGSYRAVLGNSFGYATSQVAVLTVLAPSPTSYAAAVLDANPLVYYRFSDIADGTNAFNLGSLGAANTGIYEGPYTAGPGPQPPAFPNFESTNQALVLDGSSVDVSIPALNLSAETGPNVTLAAWINTTAPQLNSYAGIIFYRGAGGASGYGLKPDTTTGFDQLEYHWANNYYQFNTGLEVTNFGNWTFTALVVEPDHATFYLNDGSGMQTATNLAAHAPVPFSSVSYVGWDANDAPGSTVTRRFAGSIDEPMIFNRSLSPAELGTLYQAGTRYGSVTLTAARSGNSLVLSWAAGTLLEAPGLNGPWTTNSAASPYTVAPTGAGKYYRVQVQ